NAEEAVTNLWQAIKLDPADKTNRDNLQAIYQWRGVDARAVTELTPLSENEALGLADRQRQLTSILQAATTRLYQASQPVGMTYDEKNMVYDILKSIMVGGVTAGS